MVIKLSYMVTFHSLFQLNEYLFTKGPNVNLASSKSYPCNNFIGLLLKLFAIIGNIT
jgi:hypothetical protein